MASAPVVAGAVAAADALESFAVAAGTYFGASYHSLGNEGEGEASLFRDFEETSYSKE